MALRLLRALFSLHCALSLAAQCIGIGPVCDSGVCNGRAGGVRTLLQPARAQCLRLSERLFSLTLVMFTDDVTDMMLLSHASDNWWKIPEVSISVDRYNKNGLTTQFPVPSLFIY